MVPVRVACTQAMEQLDPAKKPDQAAFKRWLERIDADADGKITMKEWTEVMKELQMKVDRREEEEEEEEASSSCRAKQE